MDTNQLLEALRTLPDEAVDRWLYDNRSCFDTAFIQLLKSAAEELSRKGDLNAAIDVLDRADLVGHVLDDPLARGLAWRGRANVLQWHDRFQESLCASRAAAALYEHFGTPYDVAVARTIEVYTLGALERFDEAIELALWIRPHFDREDFTLGKASLATNLAQVYTQAWRLEEALDEYRRAQDLFQQLAMTVDAAQVWHDMGVVAYRMDKLSQARDYFTRAYPEFVNSKDELLMVKTQYNLAQLCLRQGLYEDALNYLGQARLERLHLPDSPDAAYIDLFEARVRRDLGQSVQAQLLLKQSLSTFDGAGRRIEAAETLIELGHLVVEEPTPANLAQGLSYLEQAEVQLEHLSVPLLVAWVHLWQGELMLRIGRTTEATERAKAAHAIFANADLPLRRAQAEGLLADCCWRLQPDQAAQWYQSVLDTVGDAVPVLAARAWRGMGRLAAAAGNVTTAEQAYDRAVTLLERVVGLLCGHTHRAGFFEDKQALVEELLAALHVQSGNERRVLAWVERFKAKALADLLIDQPPDRLSDATLRSLLVEREQLCGELDQRLMAVAGGSVVNMAEMMQRGAALSAHDAYQAGELHELRRHLQVLDERIARCQDAAYRWREGVPIESIGVHDLLDEHTIFVSYYVAAGRLYALTATHVVDDLQVHALNTSLINIENQWWNVRRLVARSTSRIGDAQTRLAYLWEQLVAPLAQRLQNKQRLLILPHRGLFHIPFAGLYDAEHKHYLIERWSVQLAPSATVLGRCRQRIQGKGQPLLVGYPGIVGELDYLPGVEQEIKALKALMPASDMLLGAQATAEHVMAAMPDRSFIHLAGHTFFNSALPLESGMPLANGRWLHAADLYVRHGYLNGATVVLSGCNSGRGRSTGGDVLGLISAFLYAGAVGVVAGLWRVDDAATVRLMLGFYNRLVQGISTSEALCLAQRDLLRSDLYTHPYYWAPWGLNGDSRSLT